MKYLSLIDMKSASRAYSTQANNDVRKITDALCIF